ncbi:MAG: flagellar protein FlbB [Spirochaetaceae bacterium]|jgi:flagellar protein FlbB|nr:flagellar protein FlbB [Spirochaetaceae bacterium]
MARNVRSRGGFLKVFFLLILTVIIVVAGLLWLNFIGVLKIQDQLSFVTRWFGVEPREQIENPMDLYLLDNERIQKERESLNILQDELSGLQDNLSLKNQELLQREQELQELELSLEEKENSLNEVAQLYENKRANLEQNALYLMGMEPIQAKDIMLAMDDLDVVDLMRTSERLAREAGQTSLVAYWISLMPPERAAEIQRLMTEKPE